MARKSQSGADIKVVPVCPEGKASTAEDRIWQRVAELLAKAAGT